MNTSPNWIDPAVNFWHGPLQVSANRGFHVLAYWFNPRTSEYSFIGQFSQQPQHTFMPNGRRLLHADWVLEIKEMQ